jgi:hypothetical protein
MNILNVVGNPIITDTGMQTMIDAMNVAADVFATGVKPLKIHLYQTDVPLTPQTVLADLLECTWTGYAAVSLIAPVNALTPEGVPMWTTTTLPAFTGGSPLTVPGQAAGYYITDSASAVLVAVQRFENVFAFDDVGDEITVVPRMLLRGLLPA